jgi:hypothetical protein
MVSTLSLPASNSRFMAAANLAFSARLPLENAAGAYDVPGLSETLRPSFAKALSLAKKSSSAFRSAASLSNPDGPVTRRKSPSFHSTSNFPPTSP